MSIGKRIATIFRSRRSGSDDTGALKDKLDETYRTQTGLLQQVRRGVADVATSRKRVELQIAAIEQQTTQLDADAHQAVAQGDDEQARAALTRKVTLEKTATDLRHRHTELKAEEDKLQMSADKIEQEVESFRVRKDTLSARHTAASARAEINSATTGINSSVSEVGQAMESAERRTREMESKADAVDEMVTEGLISTPGESADAALSRRFDAALDSAEVDRQLEQISAHEEISAHEGISAHDQTTGNARDDQEDDDGSKPVQG